MRADFRPLEFIELEGYKSFRKLEKFALRPGLNVLIGANGSGKTNFVRFFELLGHMMDKNQGLQNYLSQRGRADAFLFRGYKVTEQLRAHLWFGLGLGEYEFTLKGADDRSMFFAKEEHFFINAYTGNAESFQDSGHTESWLVRRNDLSAGERTVVDTISGWRIYHFQDTSPGAKVMGLCNTVDHQSLHGDAGNLAAFLLRMRETDFLYYERIVKTVRLAAPYFGDFVLREVTPGQTQLLWKERYSDLIFYPYQLSDGSIRFVCLAALLLQPNPPSILIIDEPELGLHPYALELLAGLLREAASRCQLIVSTQSRQLVDELDPEDLIVVERKLGESELHRPNSAELAKWLEDYSLGELWNKNVLGGRPHS